MARMGMTATGGAGGGSSGASWVQVLNLTGAEAMTGWTAETGTWTVDAGFWKNTGGTDCRLAWNTIVPTGAMVFEADIHIPSLGAARAGVSVSNNDSAFQPLAFRSLASGAGAAVIGSAYYEKGASAADTWMKVRGLFMGSHVSAYINGALVGSAYAGADFRQSLKAMLWTSSSSAWFRNIKMWTLTGGMPA